MFVQLSQISHAILGHTFQIAQFASVIPNIGIFMIRHRYFGDTVIINRRLIRKNKFNGKNSVIHRINSCGIDYRHKRLGFMFCRTKFPIVDLADGFVQFKAGNVCNRGNVCQSALQNNGNLISRRSRCSCPGLRL